MNTAYRPGSLKEALSLRRDTIVYAGGTDLMAAHRRWINLPPAFSDPLMFIGHLKELQGVEETKDGIIIGAATTLTQMTAETAVPGLLKKVVAEMASPGVRNLATLGGNICNASPAGDTLPYLYATDARVILQESGGERELPVSRFILGPGKTALAPSELLTHILIPKTRFQITCHQKVAARRANALSKVSFLGLARMEKGRLADLRLALGAVGPTVVRNPVLEQALVETAGKAPLWSEELLERHLAGYENKITPIDDQRSTALYRRRVAIGLIQDFLESIDPAKS